MIDFLKNSIKLIYNLYALIAFAVVSVIVFPFYFFVFTFFSEQKAPHVAHKISRLWAKIGFVLFFIRLKIRNAELISKDKVYVFVANHRSMLDIPAYARSCRNTFRFLAKAELTKIPVIGYVIKKLYLSVHRDDRADRHRSLDKMKTSIDEGVSVFLCPEGTRNKTDKPLLDFKDGAFRLAIATQKPLAVLTVLNSEKLLSPFHLFSLTPGTLYAIWEKPIDTTGLMEDDIPQLKETVREMMIKNLKMDLREWE